MILANLTRNVQFARMIPDCRRNPASLSTDPSDIGNSIETAFRRHGRYPSRGSLLTLRRPVLQGKSGDSAKFPDVVCDQSEP